MLLRGHCLCGACTFELDGPPRFVCHCHCESCRRATAAPFTTWIGQPDGHWRFTGTPPTCRESSPGTRRGSCPVCGSPMFYESDRYPGERHFYAALLDNPGAVTPTLHFHAAEHLPWIALNDGLPQH
ncbi:MAG: GFA family protein [Rhodobacter sp.]|uniref:GFA family protein n=1 Tax=Pararhodobacter sp. TaxID=2127056 RepID=UPI001E163E81|nr:GFA family protein [Pararhodobacter sp.]MCB1345868.1 GFA family protein [Paracoccaceae bacterium]MCC0072876.1 GFA family protein [Rhodobacter sp.]HPD91987.1 GFA family protein [Pararhodobacter sp.]